MARAPRTGEATTATYGWVKPSVGASDDAWGGYINADLDGIDTTVKGVSDVANAAYPASNPAGYITAVAIPAPYVLPTASTTVLGGVKADGTSIKAAGDGTISTTVVPLGDNRIINGDMRIDQRNNGALVTVGGYTIDRWAIATNPAGKFSAQRVTSVAMTANGFPYALNFTSSSAYSPAVGDSFFAAQTIEADMVSDFAWGTAGAQPVTLSFWVNMSVAGTYSGSITNSPAPPTRSYPFTFTAPVGWTKVAITILGDTAGTWVMSGNAGGVSIRFDMGSGSTFRGPANAWANGNFNGAIGTVGIVTTNGAVMQITGVKLEIGSVATPYNRQSLAKSMADCQRYYQLGKGNGRFPASAANQFAENTLTFQMMRAVPTVTIATADTTINMAASYPQIITNVGYANSARMAISSAAAGDCAIIGCPYALTAEL